MRGPVAVVQGVARGKDGTLISTDAAGLPRMGEHHLSFRRLLLLTSSLLITSVARLGIDFAVGGGSVEEGGSPKKK